MAVVTTAAAGVGEGAPLGQEVRLVAARTLEAVLGTERGRRSRPRRSRAQATGTLRWA